jgi:hypothetical protein
MTIFTDSDSRRRLDLNDIGTEYERAGLDDLTDGQLFDDAARIVSLPRNDAANSFVLHAPLELMARQLLLPLVPPNGRRAVRERIVWVAAKYEQFGPPMEPAPEAEFTSLADARAALLAALAAGDLAAVDAAARPILERGTLDEIMMLAAPTLDMLAAAGHAPIGFFLASRLATIGRSAPTLLRPTLRELARAPQLRVHWQRDPTLTAGSPQGLMEALAHTPRLGLPGNDFIFPIVHQVDDGGVAREVLDGNLPTDVTTAAATTLRAAVQSMLQDDSQYAPYGWTHCLTLPHAIFEVMPWLPDAPTAAAIAATYVVGFRAAEGAHDLRVDWAPEPAPAVDLVDSLAAPPTVAAAAWYHASADSTARALPALIGRAAAHEDAHLAKYTLACLAAAERDRGHASAYLAAAASLSGWWATHGDTALRDDL